MLLIFFFTIFASGHSLERLNKHPSEDDSPSDEFYRLTKVLNRMDFHNYADTSIAIARYNFSESEYSDICFDAFVAMRFAPKEINDLRAEMSDINVFVELNNVTENFYSQFMSVAPITHLFLSSRRKAIDKLAANALPQTQKFIKDTITILMNGFLGLLRLDGRRFEVKLIVEYERKIPNVFMTTFVSLLIENRSVVEKTTKAAIKEVASLYKTLPKEVKEDLERSFCFLSTLNWINSDMGGLFDEIMELFANEVGLNLQDLLKDNTYLSKMPLHEVKKKFKSRAEDNNLTAQEYVDNCAKVFSIMKFNEEELNAFNQSADHFMGKEWGRREYSSIDELWDVLAKEGAPFVKILSRRWDFILGYPTTSTARDFFSNDERKVFKSLLGENNKQAASGEKRKLSMNLLVDREWMSARQLEQYFCLHSTMESIVEREINLICAMC